MRQGATGDDPRGLYGGWHARELLARYGFNVVEGDGWDLLWTFGPQYMSVNGENAVKVGRRAPGKGFFRRQGYTVQRWQRHNHCVSQPRNASISGSKVSQWRAYERMRRAFGAGDFSYFPSTFVLPEEAGALRAAEARGDGPFMHKANGGSQGLGVHLVSAVAAEHLRCVAQPARSGAGG